MRPPVLPGGNQVSVRIETVAERIASMRPPVLPGGNILAAASALASERLLQ